MKETGEGNNINEKVQLIDRLCCLAAKAPLNYRYFRKLMTDLKCVSAGRLSGKMIERKIADLRNKMTCTSGEGIKGA